MKRMHLLTAGALGAAITAAVAATAPAPVTKSYAVTITNLTPGQTFSPVLVATHDDSAALFHGGAAASAELALLAEEGDNSALFGVLSAHSGVQDVASGAGMIPPGGSETVVVAANGNVRFLSLAAMLVTTNDAFVGLDSVPLPGGKDVAVHAFAYDAGSEANSELCTFIPGPPCMSAGAHDPAPAEGFIAVSNGIRGKGDVDADTYDWRGPVARIEIRRE
jgi:hypothetical protein